MDGIPVYISGWLLVADFDCFDYLELDWDLFYYLYRHLFYYLQLDWHLFYLVDYGLGWDLPDYLHEHRHVLYVDVDVVVGVVVVVAVVVSELLLLLFSISVVFTFVL